MARAWHRGAAAGFAQSLEGLNQPVEIQSRRTYAHRFWSDESGRTLEYDSSQHGTRVLFNLLSLADGGIEALPEAMWKRADPFESYKPVSSSSREPEAGAHLDFMRAKRPQRGFSRKSMLDFTNKHGLLGLFYERYSGPILPNHKVWVAPNAIIEKGGRLRDVDPVTTGKDNLEKLLHKRLGPSPMTGKKVRLDFDFDLALPRELGFMARNALSQFRGLKATSEAFEPGIFPWEEVEELFGCYVILDKYSHSGVTLLSTREPLYWWKYELDSFPSLEDQKAKYGFSLESINERLAGGVAPRGYLNDQGQPERGWRCPYLLKAMYLMLYLDLTGGREIRRCQRSSCQGYYRAGPQSSSKYCSKRCANAASTRIGRGQEP
jgi:hypothetical protein